MRHVLIFSKKLEQTLEADIYGRRAGSENRERQELYRLLHNSLDFLLTPKQWEYVRLYYFEGLTQPAIAARLEVNKSTVCRELSFARKRLEVLVRIIETDAPTEDEDEDAEVIY